ncbi:MAG: hypothetical protein VKP57_01175 [Candidatus Sericytochromatia bacterium]|nr:hypothetical protein [Candidatus Sericytochromatia bacterium]
MPRTPRVGPLALMASLTAGCATFGTLDYVKDSFASAIIYRSVTVQPPASTAKTTAIIAWLPTGGDAVTRIERQHRVPATGEVKTVTFSGDKVANPPLVDDTLSPDIPYLYTLFSAGSTGTRSTLVETVAAPDTGPDLTSPGVGAIAFELDRTSADAQSGPSPQLVWQPLPNDVRRADRHYGYLVIVGQYDASSSTGIKANYTAFLDEAKHPAGAALGTPSDLEGFSSDLVGQLFNQGGLESLASGSADVKALSPGEYAWTIIPLASDLNRRSFGLGRLPAPFNPRYFKRFVVR